MLLGRVPWPQVPGVIGPDRSPSGRRVEQGIVLECLGANARLGSWATGLMPVWIGKRVSWWYPPVAPEAATEFEELGRRLVRIGRSECHDRNLPGPRLGPRINSFAGDSREPPGYPGDQMGYGGRTDLILGNFDNPERLNRPDTYLVDRVPVSGGLSACLSQRRWSEWTQLMLTTLASPGSVRVVRMNTVLPDDSCEPPGSSGR